MGANQPEKNIAFAVDIYNIPWPLLVDASQNLKVSLNAAIVANPGFSTRSDTFTTGGSGAVLDGSTYIPKSYALLVKGTGAAASSWNVILEGSLDNNNFTTLMTHTTSTGDGIILLSGANLYPVLYFRSRVTALSLGSASNIVVTIIGKG